MPYNGRQLGDSSRVVGFQRGGYCAKLRLAAVFFLLIFSNLKNILKISLKKFANSNKGCIFVSTKTVKQ